MTSLRNYINKLNKTQKIVSLIAILGVSLLLIIGVPTLARFRNRISIDTVIWDGSIATSYNAGTGTLEDPYIISNGSELAYFYTELLTNDYENTYFKLSNDIMLNKGIFSYDETNGVKYIVDNITYYMDEYTNKYYDNIERNGTEVGEVNLFNSLNGFKGNFDGNSHTIYGIYMVDMVREELALFTSLEGNIKDLYIKNAFIEGGTYTAGVASKATNAIIKNTLFEGTVIGLDEDINKTIKSNVNIPDVNMIDETVLDQIDLSNNLPYIGSEIVSTSITGSYSLTGTTDEDSVIKINGEEVSGGTFNISLGTNILDNISLSTYVNTQSSASITFSNVEYNVNYNYGISGGIVAYSKGTIIENSINKGSIKGYSVSGGIVGITTDNLDITNSYNTGDVISTYISGGLVGAIEKSSNDIDITTSYNTGILNSASSGGIFGIAKSNSGDINITNVFSTNSYNINTIINSVINITDSYSVTGNTPVNSGTTIGDFIETTLPNLKDQTYLTQNLNFNEFVSFSDLSVNPGNVWIYEEDEFPIIFIDDIKKPIATLHASVYSWNNLSTELKNVNISSSIMFMVESSDVLNPIKEKYYYISNSATALTKSELDNLSSWIEYTDVIQISEAGNYVIYAKVVDYNNKVTYINSDLLTLDFSNSLVDVLMNNNKWSNIRSELNYVYVDSIKEVSIDFKENESKIKKIEYYNSNQILSINSLNNLNLNNWTEYESGININGTGVNIIYVKVTDINDVVTYINTDKILVNGYTEIFNIGRNENSYAEDDLYITSDSSVTLNMAYSNSILDYKNGYKHNLISNILLPVGTKITLLDKINGKVYEYKINSADDLYGYNSSCTEEGCSKWATYEFTLFNEVGASINKPFVEDDYYTNNTINEEFSIIVDFSNTDIETNINNIKLYMNLEDSEGLVVRPTILSSIKEFSIYSNVDSVSSKAKLNISTDYNGTGINYNSDSSTNINITSGLIYKYIDAHKIIDTSFEDKEIGLLVKVVDSNGTVVDKEYLKNIMFKVGDETYYPGNDNLVRINFNNGFNDVTKNLTILTYETNSKLKDGTYYFKVTNYTSEDGYYFDSINNNELTIPLIVSNTYYNETYGFKVSIGEEYRIINKIDGDIDVLFDVSQSGNLDNPNIRVALYKKNEFTAYNQDYSSVDINDFITNDLTLASGDIYYLSQEPNEENSFELDLTVNNLENGGYKYIFYLYDGNKRVGAIEKNFIVK